MGDITKALQVLGKFEALRNAGVLELSIEQKVMSIDAEKIPSEEQKKYYWYREAFLYFKFKALSDFDEYKDQLTFIDKNTGREIIALNREELEEATSATK